MLILNNKKKNHNITFYWKPKQDYSVSGSIIYPRGTLVPFKGTINNNKSIISKVFAEGIQRESSSFVVETVAQYPFKKDEIIVDSDGNEYLIKNPIYKLDENQTRFMKPSSVSKIYYIGVEGDE